MTGSKLPPLPLSNRIRNRFVAAWNCLRGRPTMYRIKMVAGAVQVQGKRTLITENEFSGLGERYMTAIDYRAK